MDIPTIIGFIAGALTTTAFLPQVIKTWKSKSTKDISLVMYIAFCAGVLLWFIYGLMLESLPMIITNLLCLMLGITILILKIIHK